METAPHPKRRWPLLLGGLVLIFLFALAVKFLFLTNGPAPDEDAARAAERSKALEELNAENTKRLTTYAWVDKAKGQVQIPIEQAIELTIAELNSRPPAPAGPIAPAAPAEPAVPAEAAAPAAPAASDAQPSASPAAQPAPAN
jgi:hypothetical protein